ncbi:DUF6261 family protein [Plebeiibacterium sediminum]|uniref:DUF6261 family protein n=1 Tax=Plebeiibacterium sediminum TaxID=2992112 RepID=A0AAE3M5I4_9BACT|nr:DUF6261 family protein [Plebeiobacterium sediminum]MCW3787552.1 DUF6261 family protein [Plebeiobacterium sediminum]
MIKKVIAHSRTTEIAAVCTRIIAAFESSTYQADDNLVTIISQLKPLSVKLNKSVKRIKSESELEDKDHLRDDAVRSYYYLISGLTHHPDATIKNAAQMLLAVFNNYGLDIISSSYGIETSLINSLLAELNKTENIENINLLQGVAECIANIKSTQNDFETSYLNNEKEKAKNMELESASQIKKEAIQVINGMLVPYLKGMMAVNKDAFGEFAQVIAQIISNNNLGVKKRSKSAIPKDVFPE